MARLSRTSNTATANGSAAPSATPSARIEYKQKNPGGDPGEMKIEYYMNLIMLCLYGEFYTIMMFGRSLSLSIIELVCNKINSKRNKGYK